jgi:flagellar motor switch protein FliN/FliY
MSDVDSDFFDIYVNNRLIAKGEVVVVEDRIGVTMTEIIKTDKV